MAKYSFDEIREKLYKMVANGWEPELSMFLYDKEYMIIVYKSHCSFQRCGINDGSGEVNYDSLDKLYCTETVDNILLSRDWKDIIKFESMDVAIFYNKDF